jgi:hypothetical protein
VGWLDPLAETPENLRLAVLTVSLTEGGQAARVSPDAAEKMVREASKIWEKNCGISFVPVKHFERDAAADGVEIRANDDDKIRVLRYKYAHVNYITTVFVDDLRHSSGGDDVGGIAAYPSGDRQAVTMAVPSRNIFAHELGHYFSLPHVADDGWDETRANDPFNLMFPGDFGDSVERVFAPVQCAQARRYLLGFEHLRALCRPDAQDPELSKTNCPAVSGF